MAASERGEERLGASMTGDDISTVGTVLSAFVMLLENKKDVKEVWRIAQG